MDFFYCKTGLADLQRLHLVGCFAHCTWEGCMMPADRICSIELFCKQAAQEDLRLARRQLKAVPPGYVLVSNTSGSSPGDARALARNISTALVTTSSSLSCVPWQNITQDFTGYYFSTLLCLWKCLKHFETIFGQKT